MTRANFSQEHGDLHPVGAGMGVRRPTLVHIIARGIAIVVGVFFALPLSAAVPSPEWWSPWNTDMAWTNKSLAEIQGAAERGDAKAQYYLGRACFVGQGGDLRDLLASVRWTRRAAEQGFAQAEFMMARLCFAGVPGKADPVEAFRWLTRACDQGHAEAMALRGLALLNGEGTPRDAAKALEWYRRAVEAGSVRAFTFLGEYYLHGEVGQARRTNYVEALRWYERSASNGNASAAITVAHFYDKGFGSPPDARRSLYWTRFAADLGNADAMEKLCAIYKSGQAEPRGPDDMPVLMLRRAAVFRAISAHHEGSASWNVVSSGAFLRDCFELQNRYRYGVGTLRDYVATAEWLWVAYQENLRRHAARKGLQPNQPDVSHPFDSTLKEESPSFSLEERLWQQAVRLVHEALDENRADAWHRIGEAYRDGSALAPKQPLMAWPWFARAAEMGHPPARDVLTALEGSFTAEELGKAKRFWVPPLVR